MILCLENDLLLAFDGVLGVQVQDMLVWNNAGLLLSLKR